MKKYLALGVATSLLLAANSFATNRTTQYFTLGLGYTGISKPDKMIQENIAQPIVYGSNVTGLIGNLEWRTSRGRFTWDLGWGVLTRLCGPCYDTCSWINAVFDVHYRRLGNHDMKAVFVSNGNNQTPATTTDKTVVPLGDVLKNNITYHGLDFAAGILAAVGDSQRFVVRGQLGAMVVNSVHQFELNASNYIGVLPGVQPLLNPFDAPLTEQKYRESTFDLAPEIRVGLGYRFSCDFWAEFNYTHVFGRKLQLANDRYIDRVNNTTAVGQTWQHRAPRFDILEVNINYKV